MTEIKPFQCVGKNCDGQLDKDSGTIGLQTGCEMKILNFLICPKCGRVHWPTGEGAENRSGFKVFVTKDNEVVYEEDDD